MANRQGTLHKYFYKAADPAANEMDVAERPAERQDLEAMFAAESARADAIQQQQRQLEAMQRAWGVLKPHPFKQGSISTEHRSVSLHEGCVWCSSIPASSVGITTFFIRGCAVSDSTILFRKRKRCWSAGGNTGMPVWPFRNMDTGIVGHFGPRPGPQWPAYSIYRHFNRQHPSHTARRGPWDHHPSLSPRPHGPHPHPRHLPQQPQPARHHILSNFLYSH